MFYDKQPVQQKEDYKQMLSLVGSLSNLFSASVEPMLNYRAHENIFCKYFEASNLSREDCSADASKGSIGVGLKTWVGRDDQKVAEFGRLRPKYEHLTGMDLIQAIAEYRNSRIRITMNLHGLSEMIYHIVKRVPNAMRIYECAFDYIDTNHIVIDEKRGNANNTYFTDGNHTYHFSTSKNTLYMIFDDMELMDSFDVDILDDPYEVLKRLLPVPAETVPNEPIETMVHRALIQPAKQQLCLRLYTVDHDGTKFVAEKSGMNQWNGVRTSNRKKADGTIVHVETQRDVNEFYIPFPADDRKRHQGFFPPRDTIFNLRLPDGTTMTAKVCQEAYKKMPESQYEKATAEEKAIEDARRQEGKAIMSNPNKALGKWLLRDVFELPEGTVVTYDLLKQFGVDSVLFTKDAELDYSIDFCTLGTYEKMYDLTDIESELDTSDDE